MDKIYSSKKEASFLDEILHLKNKIRIFFWMPCFGRVRNVSSQKLSKSTVLDNFFGHGKERPKYRTERHRAQSDFFSVTFIQYDEVVLVTIPSQVSLPDCQRLIHTQFNYLLHQRYRDGPCVARISREVEETCTFDWEGLLSLIS